MARTPRKSGSDSAAAPPPAEAPSAASGSAQAPRPTDLARAARPDIATTPKPPTTRAYMAPPQGAGAPQQLRHDGSPHAEERLNTAMRILLDPAARALPSKVYSGQARNWSRR
ncbi:hypothetical protein [Bradyrhizobium sp. Ce-3]|uniref:hypothetical protein n=1 Tax=Bradyrhizobium sp. Ce-3 TaxID=2913970 RepID=UPI001FC83F87|nr:hypothetical protein [Bradyrhizobium sp. Ce-3]GKQ55034.1 hypothetical protein BRSPCE3_58890 [Bradyrhizobium sp. Ce-3]